MKIKQIPKETLNYISRGKRERGQCRRFWKIYETEWAIMPNSWSEEEDLSVICHPECMSPTTLTVFVQLYFV